MPGPIVLPMVAASFLGVLVSYVRLTKHFPDAPLRAALTVPGAFYLGVNAAISLVTYLLVVELGVLLGPETGDPPRRTKLTPVLAAGLGAPLLLQSSMASIKIGDLQLAPGRVLNDFLAQIRSAVDRRQAVRRLSTTCLERLEFDRDCVALAELVSSALQIQKVENNDAGDLGEAMGRLSARKDLPDGVKLQLLEFELVSRAGPRAVRAAARSLEQMHKKSCARRGAGCSSQPERPSEVNLRTGGSSTVDGPHSGPAEE